MIEGAWMNAAQTKLNRRSCLRNLGALAAILSCRPMGLRAQNRAPGGREGRWEATIRKGLDYLAKNQSSFGQWNTPPYPTAIAALAGTALIASGSTTTQGPYAKNISRSTDFLLSKSQPNGLIGDQFQDIRYTYGHGFSMLFLSQVLGEEGFQDRRKDLIEVLTKSVEFCGQAQTPSGGWGYVSAKDGNDYDEGSTTITQVQGLRGCRNAGIPVPTEIIESAKRYIYSCKNKDGGISYSSKQMGSSRPAITAASLACLYNAGDYDSEHVPQMLEYTKNKLHDINNDNESFGHWHYTYLYYSQVVYRQGDEEWLPFRDRLYNKIADEQRADGSWDGQISSVYVTACNLIMLQLDRGFLPIYQR
jgi:hypothetical protein